MTSRPGPALGALALLAVLVGCSTTPAARPSGTPRPTGSLVSAAPTLSGVPSPTAPADVDPLTGLAPRPDSPMMIIKVDNEVLARPYQRGLTQAAVVYEELMEGGSTRLAAVFDNAYAGEVGPIRSFRESDVDLLRQYGRVGVAFSGANRGVKRTFHAAVAAGLFLDASYDALSQDYRIGEHRADANNFFTRPSLLAQSLPDSGRTRDVGLRFGPLPAGADRITQVARAVFSPGSVVTVRYDPPSRLYQVLQDGRRVTDVAAANIIVQRVQVHSSSYVDVLGNGTPYTVTVGSGSAVVLRNGRVIDATWTRPTPASVTHFRSADGRDVPLHEGQTWILLLPAANSFTTG